MNILNLKKMAKRKIGLGHDNPLINRIHLEPEYVLKMLDVIEAAKAWKDNINQPLHVLANYEQSVFKALMEIEK